MQAQPQPQRVALGLGLCLAAFGYTAAAQGISREEALAAVYPRATIRAEQLYLTAAQLTLIADRVGDDSTPALVARYLAIRGDQVAGRAYVDTHVVRTKRESLLVSLDADGRVLRVDVTAFLEPPEYRAPQPWLNQFQGRPLDDNLNVDRAIRPIAGATLTTRAATRAVRRVLAIDATLHASGGPR
jgi:Na+-translocating ferredoxin:NAD+ oxidoreductase RnfG subunit